MRFAISALATYEILLLTGTDNNNSRFLSGKPRVVNEIENILAASPAPDFMRSEGAGAHDT